MGLLDLAGRSALVVGAGKGIGRATAIVLGEAGAHTVVLDRHPERAAEVAEAIRAAGGRADAVCADVTVADEVERAIEEASAATGGLDIGVNITGAATWVPLLEQTDAIWGRDFAVNLDQHLVVSRALVRRWLDRGTPGVLCLVGSISGLFSASNHAAYGAAKAGLLSVVRTAAEEWWPQGIRVNAVVPGSVRTPRIEETLMDPDRPIPEELVGRMALPEEVAGPIAFLVSDLARKVTGQTVVIEAGMTTKFPYALED